MRETIIHILKEDGLTILVVLGIILVYAVLHTPGDDFTSTVELEAMLTDGTPTVLEFYSNTCSTCLLSKPKVDQLEQELEGEAKVLRLNIKEPVGQEMANRLGVRGVPTFFIIDGEGRILYIRSGSPDIEGILDVVRR